MVLVAALEALALVAVVALLLRHQAAGEQAGTLERRELLTRIQHPEQTPLVVPPDFVLPEQEDDELGLVGVILEPGDEQ